MYLKGKMAWRKVEMKEIEKLALHNQNAKWFVKSTKTCKARCRPSCMRMITDDEDGGKVPELG